MIGARLPTVEAFSCPFCLATAESVLGKTVIFLECVPNVLLLLLPLGVSANHEKNFPSFFEHCRHNSSAKNLLREHEEDRHGEDALPEETSLDQCERERERERERDLDQQEKMESVN
jgi:hypothetical protein